MLSLAKTFASTSLRKVGFYDTLAIVRSYHKKEKKVSPFIQLNKKSNISQNEPKKPDPPQTTVEKKSPFIQLDKTSNFVRNEPKKQAPVQTQLENDLSSIDIAEISELRSRLNNPTLHKWLNEQLQQPESNVIECVYALCLQEVQKNVKLNLNDQLNGFINQQMKLLKQQLDSPSSQVEKTSLRQNLQLCASFLLANFEKIQTRNWNTDLLRGYSRLLRNNDKSGLEEDKVVLDYLTYAASYINASRRNKEITSGLLIVKEYLLSAAHSRDFYANDRLKNLKSYGFKLDRHIQTELSLQNGLIEEILLKSPKVSPRFLKLIEDFFNYQQMIWIVANNQPNFELAVATILTLARYFDKSTEKGSVNKFFQLAVLSLELIIKNLDQLHIPRFVYLCEVLSAFPIYKVHYTIYEDYWLAALKFVVAKRDEILLLQWRSLFYAIAKSGYVTQEFVDKVFLPKLDPAFYKRSAKHVDLYKYLVNLMQLGFRNKLMTAKDFAAHKDVLAELIKEQVYLGCEDNMVNSYLQLCTTMCRNEIYDIEVWKPFFDYVSKVDPLPNHFRYRIWYIVKHFELFAASPELAAHAKTKESFEKLLEKAEIKELLLAQINAFNLNPIVSHVSLSDEYSLTSSLRKARLQFVEETLGKISSNLFLLRNLLFLISLLHSGGSSLMEAELFLEFRFFVFLFNFSFSLA